MKHEHENPSIAIIGLGNLLMCDDGVGVHAIRELEKDQPEDIVLADVGTAVLHCQHLFEEADEIIAIDAVCAGDKPGTIYSFDAFDAEMSDQPTLHDIGLRALIELLPLQSRPNITILGVEPEKVEYSIELSQTVSNVLPQVVMLAKEMAIQKKSGSKQFVKQEKA
jgi:hydrogenase maturation protease